MYIYSTSSHRPSTPEGERKVKLVIASFSIGLIPSLIQLSAWYWTVGQSTLEMSYKGSHLIKFQYN